MACDVMAPKQSFNIDYYYCAIKIVSTAVYFVVYLKMTSLQLFKMNKKLFF